MPTMTRGELAIVVFLFVLVWGAQWLPRLAERLASTKKGR